MINALEALYALTTLAFLAALVQLIRGRRSSARRFAIAGAVGAVASAFLYWLLSSSA
ncbi:MAG: hypothetical protein ACRENU_17270 [Gemmatimonadaceae bacterium]